jgi:N-terminal domain of anti-restriction factor ArdC
MKTTESLELLAQGIKNLANRDNWIAYLKTQATFYTYSFNNVCLILQQCPHAVRVAGFHSWKKLVGGASPSENRSVKKGEKGIRILAPIVLKDPKDPDTIAGVSFKSVSVFDISQTDGKPLPEVATKLLGDDRGLLEALKAFALGQGFTVKEEDLGEINGSCSYRSPIFS